MAIAFWLLLLSVTAIAWVLGGIVERRFAIGLIVASLATVACHFAGDWQSMRLGYFFIDLTLFAAVLWLALAHDRYWPIWFGGFQFIVILADSASVVAPTRELGLYGAVGSFLALPALTFMGAGIWLDNRAT